MSAGQQSPQKAGIPREAEGRRHAQRRFERKGQRVDAAMHPYITGDGQIRGEPVSDCQQSVDGARLTRRERFHPNAPAPPKAAANTG